MPLLNWLTGRRRARAAGCRSHRAGSLSLVECLEDRTLLTAYLVDALEDTIAADGAVSLREAIQAANTNARVNEAVAGEGGGVFDQITFDIALSGGVLTLSNVQLFIFGDTSIVGLGTNQLSISGKNTRRVFTIGSDANVELSGLSLVGGDVQTTGGSGGAIDNSGSLSLTEVVIAGGLAWRGGAIHSVGDLRVSDSTITGSRATMGAGIYAERGSVAISNTTFSGNLSDRNGGGLYVAASTAVVRNTTFCGNRVNADQHASGTGAGIYAASDSSVVVENTIVAGNFYGLTEDRPDDVAGVLAAGSRHNLIGATGTAGGLVNGTSGNIVGVDYGTVIDPALRYNGGVTKTHAIIAGSAAIDAGLDSAALDSTGNPLTFDQRKFPRLVGAVDIGAYEYNAGPTVVVADLLSDVDDGDYTIGHLSLREALRIVDVGGTVTFAPTLFGGTITLTQGQLDLTRDVTITGPGADRITVDGSGSSRIFSIAAGTTTSVSGLTLANGMSSAYGGAIENRGVLALTSCVVANNTAGQSGGGIYSFGTLVVTASTIRGNSAGFDGGGLYGGGNVQIIDSTIADNFAWARGAGIAGTNLLVSGSTISGNIARLDGGGIKTNLLTLVNSTISGNSSRFSGGGISFWASDGLDVMTVRSSTIFGNHADSDGDGVGKGGGIDIFAGASYRTVFLHNSIVAGNVLGTGVGTASDVHQNSDNLNASSSHNILGIADTAGGLTSGTSGNIVGVDWRAVLDPVLRDNGGATATHALRYGPAVNAGSNIQAIDFMSDPLVNDQRGAGHARIIGGTIDIGAFESDISVVPTTVVVDTLTDEDDGNFSVGDLSLREAVNIVAAGGMVAFAEGLRNGTITLTLGQISLARNVTIVGLGVDWLSVSGNDASRIFQVVAGAIVGIRDLTLTNGRAIDGNGGAVENRGSLALTQVAIINSAAAGDGGGVYLAAGGELTLTSSTIEGNMASRGGGVGVQGTLTVTGSTIANNSAVTGGGGVYIGDSSNRYRLVHISDSTVSGNTASIGSGGIANFSGRLTLANVTIFGNRTDDTSAGVGAGLHSFDAHTFDVLLLTNTIVAGNVRSGGIASDLSATVATAIHAGSCNNLIGDRLTSGGFANGVNGNIVGVDWTMVLDPELRDNGGTTATHALLRSSVAVNAGADREAIDAGGAPLQFDQRGEGHLRVLRGRVDIGAFELANAPPVSNDDGFEIDDDGVLFSGFVGNLFADNGTGEDLDLDGDPLAVTAVNGVASAVGTQIALTSGALLIVGADGLFTFDFNGAFVGLHDGETAIESFTYTIADGQGDSATATVTILIRGVSVPPVAAGDQDRLGEYGHATGNLLMNDSDGDGDPLIVAAVNGDVANVGAQITLPSGALLTVNADGAFTYDPNGCFARLRRGETADDSFTYTIDDRHGGAATATVLLTIEGGGETDLIGYYDGEWLLGASTTTSFESSPWANWSALAPSVVKQGDFNGDGLVDVVGFDNGAWWVGISNGSSFVTAHWAAWPPRVWQDVTQIAIGDVDGDGDDDVLARYLGSWWVGVSDGSSFTAQRWAGWSDKPWQHVSLVDLDADGDDDLLANFNGAWWASLSNGSSFEIATRWGGWGNDIWDAVGTFDANGDSRVDVFAFGHGRWYVGISEGTSFTIGLRSVWKNAAWADAVVGDFDGDGRDDVAARLAGAWWVELSTPTGGAGSTSHWAAWKDLEWRNVTVGDFDGDGRADIAARHKFGWWVARAADGVFETSLWGTWKNVEWTAVAAAEIANPVAAPSAASAQAASLTNKQDVLATLWSSTDDDEFAAALLAI